MHMSIARQPAGSIGDAVPSTSEGASTTALSPEEELCKLRKDVEVLTAKLGAAQQDSRDAKSKAKHQNNELAAAQKALLEKKKGSRSTTPTRNAADSDANALAKERVINDRLSIEVAKMEQVKNDVDGALVIIDELRIVMPEGKAYQRGLMVANAVEGLGRAVARKDIQNLVAQKSSKPPTLELY